MVSTKGKDGVFQETSGAYRAVLQRNGVKRCDGDHEAFVGNVRGFVRFIGFVMLVVSFALLSTQLVAQNEDMLVLVEQFGGLLRVATVVVGLGVMRVFGNAAVAGFSAVAAFCIVHWSKQHAWIGRMYRSKYYTCSVLCLAIMYREEILWEKTWAWVAAHVWAQFRIEYGGVFNAAYLWSSVAMGVLGPLGLCATATGIGVVMPRFRKKPIEAGFLSDLSGVVGVRLVDAVRVVSDAEWKNAGVGFSGNSRIRMAALLGDRLFSTALARHAVAHRWTVAKHNYYAQLLLSNASFARFFDVKLATSLPKELRIWSEDKKGTYVEALFSQVSEQEGWEVTVAEFIRIQLIPLIAAVDDPIESEWY